MSGSTGAQEDPGATIQYLLKSGLSDTTLARILSLPRHTVRNWAIGEDEGYLPEKHVPLLIQTIRVVRTLQRLGRPVDAGTHGLIPLIQDRSLDGILTLDDRLLHMEQPKRG